MAKSKQTTPELEASERDENIHTVLSSEFLDAEWSSCAPSRPALARSLALLQRAAQGLSAIDRVLRADRQLHCYKDNADDSETVKVLPLILVSDLEAGQTALIGMFEREMDHLREWLGEFPLTEPTNRAMNS